MAYGLEILSTEGLVDVVTFRAARLYSSITLTTTSGSTAVSGFNSNDGFVYLRSNNSDIVANWSWNNSSGVLTWTANPNTSSPSSNMTAFFMVTT